MGPRSLHPCEVSRIIELRLCPDSLMKPCCCASVIEPQSSECSGVSSGDFLKEEVDVGANPGRTSWDWVHAKPAPPPPPHPPAWPPQQISSSFTQRQQDTYSHGVHECTRDDLTAADYTGQEFRHKVHFIVLVFILKSVKMQLMCASQSFNDAAPLGPADTHQTLTALTWNWSSSASGRTNDRVQTLEITLRHGGGFQLQHATWQECLRLLPWSWLAGANKNWLG